MSDEKRDWSGHMPDRGVRSLSDEDLAQCATENSARMFDAFRGPTIVDNLADEHVGAASLTGGFAIAITSELVRRLKQRKGQ